MGFLKTARFSVSYKTRNHSQIIQTTHKPPKNHPQTGHTTHKPVTPPINQSKHPQTSQIPANHPLISQKLHPSFPAYRTQELQHLPHHIIWPFYPFCARREMGAFFYIHARFSTSLSPLHSSLQSLIADYNPSHKLLTQLQTLTNFSRRLWLMMLHWKFYLY